MLGSYEAISWPWKWGKVQMIPYDSKWFQMDSWWMPGFPTTFVDAHNGLLIFTALSLDSDSIVFPAWIWSIFGFIETISCKCFSFRSCSFCCSKFQRSRRVCSCRQEGWELYTINGAQAPGTNLQHSLPHRGCRPPFGGPEGSRNDPGLKSYGPISGQYILICCIIFCCFGFSGFGLLVLFISTRPSHQAILMNIWHIWEARSQNMVWNNMSNNHGNLWPFLS